MNSTTTSSTFGSNHELAKIFAGANTAKSSSGLSSAFLPWGATIESRKAIEASGVSTATLVAPNEALLWGEGFEIAPTTTTSMTDPASQTSPITTVSTVAPSLFRSTPAKPIFSAGVPPLYVAPAVDEVIADAPQDQDQDQDPLLLLPAPSGEPISTVGENEKVSVLPAVAVNLEVPVAPKQRAGLFGGGPSAAATISQAGKSVNAPTPSRNGLFNSPAPLPSNSNFTQQPVRKNVLTSLWGKLSGKGKNDKKTQANTPKASSRVVTPVTRNLADDTTAAEPAPNSTTSLFTPNAAPDTSTKISQWTQSSPTFGK